MLSEEEMPRRSVLDVVGRRPILLIITVSLPPMDAFTAEIHVGRTDPAEPGLPLESDGIVRYVWHGKYGDMLVEVRDGSAFVNGQRVEPALDGQA